MDLAHHLDRSQRCLDWVPVNLAAGDCARAAESLGKAASHAVTAAAVHWGYPYKSRRRLTSVLRGLLSDGKIVHADISAFHQVYRLPAEVANAASADAARRLIRRLRTRVRRLRNAISNAVSGIQPNTKPPRPRYRVKVFRAPDGRPLSPLEIAAINRPELYSWIDKWSRLCGVTPPPPPPAAPPPPPQPAPPAPADWPNPQPLSGKAFRWPVPVD